MRADVTCDIGIHLLKDFDSHELLPYTPSVFGRSAISAKVVSNSSW